MQLAGDAGEGSTSPTLHSERGLQSASTAVMTLCKQAQLKPWTRSCLGDSAVQQPQFLILWLEYQT